MKQGFLSPKYFCNPSGGSPFVRGFNDKLNISISSAAAEVLPSVGPPSSCMLEGERSDAEGIASLADMAAARAVWQCISHTRIQAGIPWPVILVVRDSSFRWREPLLKGAKSLSLHCRVERGASVGPSKAQGLKLKHTHSHMGPGYSLYTLSHRHKWDAHM